MLKLRVVQAAFGDCLILQHGPITEPKYILIDGGPPNIFVNHLRGELTKIAGRGGRLELLVLSHIDNDHICGIVDLLTELKNQRSRHLPETIPICGLWHNSFDQTIGAGNDLAPRLLALTDQARQKGIRFDLLNQISRGVGEGEQVQKLAMDLMIPRNAGFKDGFISRESAASPILLDDLKLWILGPDQRSLVKLQKEWLSWLKKQEKKVAAAVPRAAGKDSSAPNLSSIIFLAVSGGRRILLSGDSTGDEILAGLKNQGLLDSSDKLHVDVFKLPHHGSVRNVCEEFFEKLTADDYVISANGMNGNPEFQTLEWIIQSAYRQGRQIRIFVTNETETTSQALRDLDPRTYGYMLKTMSSRIHSTTI